MSTVAVNPGGRARRIWDGLLPNRYRKILAAFAYVAAVMCGISTLLYPPRSIEGILGAVLTNMFGAFYLLGGLVALGAVFVGWWWAERGGIAAIGLGVLIYIIVVVSLHFQEATGSRLSQYWAIALALPLLAYRFGDIIKHPYEPRTKGVGAEWTAITRPK